jgi:hypothetical protein
MRWNLAFVLLTAFSSATAQRAPVRPQVRDSSGVRITEWTGIVNDLPQTLRISEQPVLDLGGAREPPEHELSPGEHFFARLSNQHIVVAEATNLKVFDKSGAYVRTIGRPGKGPGEFHHVYGVCVGPGDVIVGLDGREASVFDRNGVHVRSFANPAGEFVRFGCFRDGSLVQTLRSRQDPGDPVFSRTTARRIGLDGSEVGELGSFPEGVWGPARSFVQSIPSIVPNGEFVFVGDSRDAEIRVYRMDGKLVRIVRWGARRIPLTQDLLLKIGTAVHDRMPKDSVIARVSRARRAGVPENLPVYAGFRIDGIGRIWVQDYYLGRLLGNYPPQWTVFDSVGIPLGRVALPRVPGSRADIVGMDGTRVVLSWRDSIGFPHLSFHDVTPVRR